MRTGVISETVLKRSVLKKIKYKSPLLVQGPAAGVRCSRLSVGERQQMLFAEVTVSGDPGVVSEQAFYRMANDISASGGRPTGMLVSMFLPEPAGEDGIKQVMGELAGLAHTYQVDVLGGHTEIVTGVTQPVLSVTGIGVAEPGMEAANGKLVAGQDIVMTKWAGATGAAALVKRERNRKQGAALAARFSTNFLDRAAEYFRYMSSVRDVEVALGSGATALQNAGKSGLFGALWEMGERSGVGFSVDLKRISVCQEAVEVCEWFNSNPYLISSDGVLLAGTNEGEPLVRAFAQAGIPAAVIGTVTKERGRVIVSGDEQRFLVPPGSSSWNY